MDNETLARQYYNALESTGVEGIDNVIAWLKENNFEKEYAAAKHHGNYEGGLMEHSWKVMLMLKKFTEFAESNKEFFTNSGFDLSTCNIEKINLSRNTIIITALLHDICKVGCYHTEFKNKKVYSPDGKKHDDAGNFDWKSVPAITFKDENLLGHGEKSVIQLLQLGLKLTDEEIYMIRWHMGGYTPSQNSFDFNNACEKYPGIFLLHLADNFSAQLCEATVDE